MPLNRIVIAGGGVVGWMTASALARALTSTATAIIVIHGNGDDDSLGMPTGAEPTLPSTTKYHAKWGYDEDALIRAARGTFALGIAQSEWNGSPTPTFHPFGDCGAPIGAVPFHQLIAKMRSQGHSLLLANYAVAALCAQAGRFMRPLDDPRSPLSTFENGLHLDSAAYAKAMRNDATSQGVAHISGTAIAAKRGEDGMVEAVITHDGQHVEGDLFIDCTGQKAVLSPSSFENWQHWLPCDRMINRLTDTAYAPPLPFTHIEAHQAGWRRRVPLQGSESETMVFAHNHVDEGQLNQPAYRFTSGYRPPWTGNVIAIGGASGVIDPLASTAIHLTQSAITRLIALLPHDHRTHHGAAEFNRSSRQEWECARDFAILFYKKNARVGDPFWDECRDMPIPDSLAYRIELYENMGRIMLLDGEVFEASGWIAQCDALGLRPKRYDALACALPDDAVAKHFTKLRDIMIKSIASVPPHSDYINYHCRASS